MDYESLAKEFGGSFVTDTSDKTDLDTLIAQYGGSLVKPEEKKKQGLAADIKRGAEQLVSSGQTAVESVTKGGEEAAIRAQERQSDISRRLGEGASFERLQDVYKQQGLLAAAKELGGQIPSAIAEQLPNIGATVAGGLTGAAAGSLAGPVGTVVGGITGAFAPSFVQQYGGNIQRQAEAQQAQGKPLEISRTAAAGAAAPMAALDVAGTLIPLGGNIVSKILGPTAGKLIGGGGSKLAEEALLTTVMKGTATGVLAEIPTEVTQQMLERAQAGLALTNDDALKEYGETAFAVSLLGPLGIIGRVQNKAQAGRDLAAAQALAAQTGEPQLIPLQLTYDPNVPTTRGEEVMTVFPDGRIAPTEESAFQERFQRTPIKGVTEAYAIPGDKEAIMAARMEEARKYSPAMQKINEIAAKKQQLFAQEQAKLDAIKSQQSAFTNAEFENGVIKAPTPEQIAEQEAKTASYQNFRTVARQVGNKVEVYEGILNEKGKVNVKDPVTGKTLTFNPNSPNIVIDPTEKDIFEFETRGLGEDLKAISKEIKDTEKSVVNAKEEFKSWLQKNKIREDQIFEVLPDVPKATKGGYTIGKKAKNYFDKEGSPIDDLTARALEDGIITQEEFDDPTDIAGERAFIDKVKALYADELVTTAANKDAIAEVDALYSQKDQLEQEFEKRKEIAATPTEEETVAPEFVAPEAATPAGPVTPAEYAQTVPVTPSTNITPEGDVLFEAAAPNAIKITDEDKRIESELKGKSLLEVSDWAVKNAPNNFAKAIAGMVDKRIKQMNARGIKLDFDIQSGSNRLAKMYGAKGMAEFKFGKKGEETSAKITLNGAAALDNQLGYPPGTNYVTILHELLHVATKGQLFLRSKNDPLVVKLNELRNQVVAYYNKRVDANDMTPFIERMYKNEINALRNIDELVSWGLTDRDMQEFLSEIKVGEKTIFNKFVDLIRQIIGIAKNFETALDRLITTSESILNEDIETIAGRLESQSYSFGVKGTPKPFTGEQQTLFQQSSREKFKAPMQGVDPKIAELARNTFTQEQATVKEKMEGLKKNFFERMVIGLFDEFRAIKKYDPAAYMMARLSKSIDGGLQGLLEYGQVYLKDGALAIQANTKGLLKILEPVGPEVDQYQMWKALNRDANLPAEKRSLPAELVANRDQFSSGNLNGKPRKAIYEQALREENELNKSVLKIAKELGLIDQAGYDKFASDIYYIPFYKMMEEGDVQSVSNASKLTGQQFSKALKGGEKQINDLMENVLLNWSHILSAAMKNQAAVKTIDAAQKMGAAKEVKPMDGKYPKDSVKVMKDGKAVHYELSDPDLVDAIATISYLGPKSHILDISKGFTNALRYGITMSPAYKVRNLIRDSIQSAAVSELGNNMFKNVYDGLAMSKDGHPTFMAALAGGGIFEMGTAHEGNQAKLIKRLVDKGVNANHILDTTDKIKAKLGAALDWYNEQGNKFENANRLALYQKLIDSGKTHLEASFAARDLMDFSMQGQFKAIKIIGSVVPFFNARLQGLYKLGRDGITPTYRVICNATTGKPIDASDKQKAARFATISSAVMLASLSLYAMYKDDEDFKRREDWDRDNFWWFKIGDTAFRIPKPFEIGALGTIAERTYEQISDENVEGKVFADRLNHILMDTFSLNPTPQMIKPLIDLYANKDSFTGAPIESAGMSNLSKQERVTNKTSGVAIALGGVSEGAAKILTFNPQAQGFSPIQIDYAIKSYLGWLGATAVSTADLAVEPFQEGTKVHPPLIDTVAMGFIKTEPQTQSKYMTQFYQNNENLQSALADMRHYAELGDSEKVQKIYEERGDDIALAKVYDKTSKQFAALRKQSRLIENNPNIPAEEKRAEMNRLKIIMSDMAEQTETLRKQLKK